MLLELENIADTAEHEHGLKTKKKEQRRNQKKE